MRGGVLIAEPLGQHESGVINVMERSTVRGSVAGNRSWLRPKAPSKSSRWPGNRAFRRSYNSEWRIHSPQQSKFGGGASIRREEHVVPRRFIRRFIQRRDGRPIATRSALIGEA